MVPSATSSTVQPWWVHTVEKALKVPARGCVTTTFWVLKILPPPTGMSEAGPNAVPPAPAPPPAVGAPDPAGWSPEPSDPAGP
jgi:hypothetical protein